MSDYKLPPDFLPLMRQQWGTDLADRLCQALADTEASVSVRVNPDKAPCARVSGSPVPWCPWGYYLSRRPAFTFDPLLHAGAYYVQDASSMFLWHLLRDAFSQPVVALDLCAAPGGKSTLLRSLLPEGSLLVSNEPMRQRAQVLAENLTKWGNPNTVVTQNYPDDFAPFPGFFDLIVADVPCSGEGMFRKDVQAINDWSPDNVDLCRKRQRQIIEAIWPALKPGGLLVYSTCTFNHFENEDNVHWISSHLGAEVLSVPVEDSWHIHGSYHFLPGFVRGEGQFMALLRKQAADTPANCTLRTPRDRALKDEPRELRNWLQGDFSYFLEKDVYRAFPTAFVPHYARLSMALHILSAGVTVGVRKGKDWQPAHALAMSTALRPDAFPTAAVTYEQALAYLRHESLQIDAPRGYVLLTCQGLPLGFVKNLGSRANNLYPAEWRIRSGYTTPFTLFPSL